MADNSYFLFESLGAISFWTQVLEIQLVDRIAEVRLAASQSMTPKERRRLEKSPLGLVVNVAKSWRAIPKELMPSFREAM